MLSRLRPGAARVTDKAPMNFVHLHLIRLALPEARIVHCRGARSTPASPTTSPTSGIIIRTRARESLVAYTRQYEKLMAHWRAVLPSDRFAEVHYERLVADRESETRRLIAFVGLDWNDACLAPEKNERVIKTASLWQARQPVYGTSVERWRRYEPWLGALRELLPKD